MADSPACWLIRSQKSESPLFRDEALARFRSAIWQPALLSKQVSGYLLAVLSVAAGMGLAGFAGAFEFARKEQVQGYLTPAAGWARVAAKSLGVVRRRFVAPGDSVQSGDVLLEVSPGNGLQRAQTVQDRMLEEIEGRRGTLTARLRLTAVEYEQDVALLVQQNAADSRNLARLEGEIALSQARARIAQKRYEDGRRLVASGALPKAELVQLQEEVQARLLSLSERRGKAERLRTGMAANEARLEGLAVVRDLKQASIQEQLHALAMEESRLRSEGAARLLAPRSGKIASVRVRVGDGVRPGQVLLDIVPEGGELQARLFAPPAAMGFVEPGQEVRVYIDAFPYERHGAQLGRVLSVSETAIAPDLSSVSQGTAGPAYRIEVVFPKGFTLPPAQLGALRPGMTVTADLVRDYGTLVDWLLEPLRGTVKRL